MKTNPRRNKKFNKLRTYPTMAYTATVCPGVVEISHLGRIPTKFPLLRFRVGCRMPVREAFIFDLFRPRQCIWHPILTPHPTWISEQISQHQWIREGFPTLHQKNDSLDTASKSTLDAGTTESLGLDVGCKVGKAGLLSNLTAAMDSGSLGS